jgi:SAM-dependent methyltransferase
MEKNTKKPWSNSDNKQFYENVPVEEFEKYTIIGGFENGCDIDVIYNRFLKNAASIVDVGAGYGRVLKHILDHGYSGKLIAIERSCNFYSRLYKNFSGRADLFNCSVADFKKAEVADVVLCMWSMLSEWPKDEQISTLRHISTFCKPGGIIILENLSHLIAPVNMENYNQQYYESITEHGSVCGYTASTDEIKEYAHTLNMPKTEHIEYTTSTGRQRIIHILWV